MPGALKNRDTILEDIVANLRSSQPGVGCLGWWWGLKTCSPSPSVRETVRDCRQPGKREGPDDPGPEDFTYAGNRRGMNHLSSSPTPMPGDFRSH